MDQSDLDFDSRKRQARGLTCPMALLVALSGCAKSSWPCLAAVFFFMPDPHRPNLGCVRVLSISSLKKNQKASLDTHLCVNDSQPLMI